MVKVCVVEPDHFFAAPAPRENFVAALAVATLLYCKESCDKWTEVSKKVLEDADSFGSGSVTLVKVFVVLPDSAGKLV
jgi:hypothetical protein